MIKAMIGDLGLKVDLGVTDAQSVEEAQTIRAEERSIYDSFMKDIQVFAEMIGDAAKLAEFREHLESASPEDFAPGQDSDDD